MLIEFVGIVMSTKEILIFIRWQSLYINDFFSFKNKIKKKKIPKKKFQKKNPKKYFFLDFFFKIMKFGLKQNHEIAGITNCEITKCGDPLYEHNLIP